MKHWQPSASHSALRARAALNQSIREFFASRDVLEVETPILMRATAAEPHLKNFRFGDYALQTSPESAMKRLLCAGSGAIYQLGKAFRADEQGKRHNPEFTMLEWYQPHVSFDDMVAETLAVIRLALPQRQAVFYPYQTVFSNATGLNPHCCSDQQLAQFAGHNIVGEFTDMSRSDWLDLIMSEVVEATFDPNKLTVITGFPACQAALAKLSSDDQGQTVACRFEVYSGGLELANGYDELCDPVILASVLQGCDNAMLKAFEANHLHRCCGVALGIDRLLMLQLGLASIKDVLAFDFSRT